MSQKSSSTTVPKSEPPNIWRGIGSGSGGDTPATNQSNDAQPNNKSLPESELESEERLAQIFKSLDHDGNGRIDIQELTSSLKGSGMPHQYAEVSCSISVVVNSKCFEQKKTITAKNANKISLICVKCPV